MNLMQEKEKAKKKMILTAVLCTATTLSGITIVLLSGLLAMAVWLRLLLIGEAALIIACGIALACVLDQESGVYECRNCGERFVPDMKSYVMGAHTLTRRRLKCPKCGEICSCKKRLSR